MSLRSMVLLVAACATNLLADDWPQWLGPQRDAIWRETGILKAFPSSGPKIVWRIPVGAGYSGPAVKDGRVYLTDRRVRKNTTVKGSAFEKALIPGDERVFCLNAEDGRLLWEHVYESAYNMSYPAGPRATPIIAEGRVYALGAEGDLHCLDASSGKSVWAKSLKKEYGLDTPVWGFSAHPLLDGDKLICLVGGEGSVAVAFDKRNGKELWRALSAKEPGYCPPVIYDFAGVRQLIIWHPQAINSLDPDSGKLRWTHPFEVRSGLSIPMPRKYEDKLFITSFYNGPILLRPGKDKAEVLWKGKSNSERNTDGLHSIMATPFIEGGYIYGVCSYGQLRCLKAESGERVWETFAATTGGKEVRWANAFLIKHEDRFFLPNEKGDLIIARLTPERYEEISRTHLLDPTNFDPGREVVWSHPAFANRRVYARNDKEIVCVDLSEKTGDR